VKTILDEIGAERERQITQEGWTSIHDDAHDKGEMAHAAGTYALANHSRLLWIGGNEVPLTWPWSKRWWKPKDRRRNLVMAAALIVAEIERLDRSNSSGVRKGES
jgi:hypothetical protein